MDELKKKIEAVLFVTGKFMTFEEIADFAGISSVGLMKDAMEELVKDYDGRDCALRIIEEKGKFKLNIKRDYNYLTTKLASGAELDGPTQATLALIAYKQPVKQSEIIKMRGNTAYDHVKELKEQGFITREKFGRTRLLKVTQKFYDYFDVVDNVLQDNFMAAEDKVLEKVMEKKFEKEDKVEELEKEEGEDWGEKVKEQ
jgi:segregation and condensation protein B